jgi:hypothetical protein
MIKLKLKRIFLNYRISRDLSTTNRKNTFRHDKHFTVLDHLTLTGQRPGHFVQVPVLRKDRKNYCRFKILK